MKDIEIHLSKEDREKLGEIARKREMSLTWCATELLTMKIYEELERITKLLGKTWEDE